MKPINIDEVLKEYRTKFRRTIVKRLNDLLVRTNPYKVYYAFLDQTGTSAPVATVFKNDFHFDITYSYAGVGAYTGTASISGVFPIGKSFIRYSGNEYNVSALNDKMTVFGSDFNDTSSFFISVGVAVATGARDTANDELHHMIEIIVFD